MVTLWVYMVGGDLGWGPFDDVHVGHGKDALFACAWDLALIPVLVHLSDHNDLLPLNTRNPPPHHVFTSDAGRLIPLLRVLRTSYLSERQLHVGVSVEVVASHSLSDLSDLRWGGRTDRLLLLCGRHLLLVCEEKKGGSEETTFS